MINIEKILNVWLDYMGPREGITQKVLAERSGLDVTYISKIKKGLRNPRHETLEKLAGGFGVSVAEFLAGPPGMKIDHIRYGVQAPTEHDNNITEEYTYIPYYDISPTSQEGLIPAQEKLKPICAFRTEWLWKGISVIPSTVSLIMVSGDSMEPTLSDGDVVLIDGSLTRLDKDGLYVFRFNDILLVKRLKLHINGKLEISSDNESYPKLIIDPSDVEELMVIGRVLWYGRTVS